MFKVSLFCFFIVSMMACSTTKIPVFEVSSDYYQHPFIKKYQSDPSFMDPGLAKACIVDFNRRKFKLKGAESINKVAWASFDRQLMAQLTNDSAKIAYVRFYFAINPTEKIEGKISPFIIMAVTPYKVESALGSSNSSLPIPHAELQTQTTPDNGKTGYFRPIQLCPPPEEGCGL